MRNVNKVIMSASDAASQNGLQIDASQLVMSSFQMYFGDATAAGTFKLQMSNDLYDTRYLPQDFVVVNWTDIPSSSVAVTTGTTAVLFLANMCYRWIRAVWTPSAGVQTIVPVADSSGSLNSTYFFINAGNNGTAYYVWFDDGAGVDPAIGGKTGVHITYTDNDTAATIGGKIATALNALTTKFTASGTTTVTVTNVTAGPFTAATDFNTGFAFHLITGGTSTINVAMNAMSV